MDHRDVAIVAYDGLCTFEYGVAVELFGLPRPELRDWYRAETVGADPGPLRMTGGTTLTAGTDLARVARAGTVVLPGWRDPDEPPPAALVDALHAAYADGARLLSICSGVFVLAATGLLDGAAATTHWSYADRLARRFPAIDVQPDVLYVDNGRTLTSAGSAAGLDLGLHLIRRDFGADVANLVARRLVVSPHRDGGQAQFVESNVRPPAGGGSLGAVLDWAAGELHRPIGVEELAVRAHLAPRTLARRFRAEVGTTPHRWLTQQRVALAQRLLETTDAGVDGVADAAGFGTAMTLRHHFRAALGTSPTAYRARFRHAPDGAAISPPVPAGSASPRAR